LENLFYNEKQIKQAEQEIDSFLHLGRFKPLYEILTSIPGIGNTVCACLISEILPAIAFLLRFFYARNRFLLLYIALFLLLIS